MAYPTNSLASTLENIDREIASIKSAATRYRTTLETDTVATVIIDIAIRARRHIASLNTAAAVPGIAAYARDMKNDQGLDIVAEFNTVKAAVQAVQDWITTNFPTDGSGFLLRETWGANGPVDRSFPAGQTAGLRTLLATVEASIA